MLEEQPQGRFMFLSRMASQHRLGTVLESVGGMARDRYGERLEAYRAMGETWIAASGVRTAAVLVAGASAILFQAGVDAAG